MDQSSAIDHAERCAHGGEFVSGNCNLFQTAARRRFDLHRQLRRGNHHDLLARADFVADGFQDGADGYNSTTYMVRNDGGIATYSSVGSSALALVFTTTRF